MFREIRTRERITEEDERRKRERELGYLSIKPKTEEFQNMSIRETQDMLKNLYLNLMENEG